MGFQVRLADDGDYLLGRMVRTKQKITKIDAVLTETDGQIGALLERKQALQKAKMQAKHLLVETLGELVTYTEDYSHGRTDKGQD